MRPRARRIATLAFAFGAFAACQGEPGAAPDAAGVAPSPSAAPAPGGADLSPSAPSHEGVTAALEAAGLAVGRFTPEPGSTCARGSIEGLEGLLCPSDPSAEAAARRFLDGAVNGAFRDARGYVLAVADRENSDPRGVRINKVLKAFSADAPR